MPKIRPTQKSSNSTAAAPRRWGIGMVVGMWILILAMMTIFFQDWWNDQQNPNQSAMTQVDMSGLRELALERNRWGHYVANGAINGEKVVFMLDTGATDVAIPVSVADRLGLQRGPVQVYQTANGSVRVYATRLASVSLGGIVLHDIRASINPGMEQDEVLLGMSFLKHLEFTQLGNTLTLRQFPE